MQKRSSKQDFAQNALRGVDIDCAAIGTKGKERSGCIAGKRLDGLIRAT